jgi:hypothetical protein
MKIVIPAFLLTAALVCVAIPATGAEVRVGANDTVQSVLAANKGGRVTVRVRSGQELTGVVREINGRVVHLGALAGREFFDAVVALEAVDAVIVRTKE